MQWGDQRMGERSKRGGDDGSGGKPEDATGPEQGPSKSQRKREAQALFHLGRELAEMPEAHLLELPLDPDLLEAVRTARGIRSHGARKRQLGFVAGLLRRRDVSALREALEGQQRSARELTARQHRSEAWRDCLLERGDSALGALLDERTDVDVQALRQLLRNARREARQDRPPASARKLFRLLRELDERAALPPPPG
jgi:ribosome-associated protein